MYLFIHPQMQGFTCPHGHTDRKTRTLEGIFKNLHISDLKRLLE